MTAAPLPGPGNVVSIVFRDAGSRRERVPVRRVVGRAGAAAALALLALAAGGCSGYKRDEALVSLARSGDLGVARERAAATLRNDPKDRSYTLGRAKLLALTAADGVPEAAEPVADRLYDLLRTQGANAGNGFGTFFVGEDNARVYKGEPFEQAVAFTHIAAVDGMNGDWGNVRASINNALFQIRDYSRAIAKGREAAGDKVGDDERAALVAGAAAADKDANRNAKEAGYESFEALSAPVPSDFEAGYALKVIAARQLQKPAEVDEAAAQLNRVNPNLGELAQRLRTEPYNAVFLVDFGTGPQKIRYGMDNAYSKWEPLDASDGRPLVVTAGGRAASFPVVTDVNRLAQDLRWNNLEDLRVAKSIAGTVLVAGGATMLLASNDSTTQAIGAGLLAFGALMKATSGADIRHNELLPQRIYVATATLTQASNVVELAIEGLPDTRLVLAAVPAPGPGEGAILRYVRLPQTTAAWATSGRVFFASDEAPAVLDDASNFPYILGGRCTRTPTEEALSSYQRAGHLRGYSFNDLLDLYREEGILIAGFNTEQEIGRHVLEGGAWLYSPLAGTVGFARLYGTDRPPYQPRSSRVAQAAAAERAGGPAPRTAAAPSALPARATAGAEEAPSAAPVSSGTDAAAASAQPAAASAQPAARAGPAAASTPTGRGGFTGPRTSGADR